MAIHTEIEKQIALQCPNSVSQNLNVVALPGRFDEDETKIVTCQDSGWIISSNGCIMI